MENSTTCYVLMESSNKTGNVSTRIYTDFGNALTEANIALSDVLKGGRAKDTELSILDCNLESLKTAFEESESRPLEIKEGEDVDEIIGLLDDFKYDVIDINENTIKHLIDEEYNKNKPKKGNHNYERD